MGLLLQNWWVLLIIGAYAFMMFRGGGCCGTGGHAHNGGGGCCGGGSYGDHERMGHYGSNSGQPRDKIEMVRDPECGMFVDPKTSTKQNLNGKTYYFCSEVCRANFVKKNRDSLQE